MKANVGIACGLAAVLLFAAKGASAQGHANGFGEKGQLILTADRLVPVFSYTYGTVTHQQNNGETTTSSSGSGLSLLFGQNLADTGTRGVPINVHTIPRVAFDITVIRSLTVGAGVAFGFGLGGTNEVETRPNGGRATSTSNDAPTATAIGFTPRVGYIVPIGSVFAFWPRLGMGIYSISSSHEEPAPGNAVATVKTNDTLFSLDLDPQFAIVPLEHFFFHVGPVVNIPLTGSRSGERTIGNNTTPLSSDDATMFNFGISAGLGGWFNVF